jgi:hypothetical protein
LRWQGDYAAGKNKIINGDFGIWQRGTSFAGLTTTTYTADRWSYVPSGATATVTREAFTAGTAPVAGYEAPFFLRVDATVANDFWGVFQKIEDVRNFAGQAVTFSFWAKTATAQTFNATVSQFFGSGGSADVTAFTTNFTTSTSWTRYTFTGTVPSVSGKTIAANSNLQAYIRCVNNATGTLDVWGVQLEAGSTATAFQTATGTIQGELAACQRYYYRFTSQSSFSQFGIGQATGSTSGFVSVRFPVSMRIRPTALEQSGTASNYGVTRNNGGVESLTSVPNYDGVTTSEVAGVGFTTAGNMTAGNASYMLANNNTTAFLGWSAEL